MIPIALATCLVFQQVKAGPIYQGPQHQRVQRSVSEEEYETPGESLGEFVEEDLRSGENGDAEGLSKDPQVVDTGVEFLISNGQVSSRGHLWRGAQADWPLAAHYLLASTERLD